MISLCLYLCISLQFLASSGKRKKAEDCNDTKNCKISKTSIDSDTSESSSIRISQRKRVCNITNKLLMNKLIILFFIIIIPSALLALFLCFIIKFLLYLHIAIA